MGAALSVCACGDDTVSTNPIASLASRCTNPPKSSVYDEDDDGTRLSGDSITLDDADGSIVRAEKAQKESVGFGTSCTDDKACSDIKQGLKDEVNPSSATIRSRLIRPAAGESNSNRPSSGKGRASDFDLTKPHPLDPPFLGSENNVPSTSSSSDPSSMRVQNGKMTSVCDTEDINNAKACTPNRTTTASSSGTPESLRSMLTSTTVSSADAEDRDSLDGFYDGQCSTPVRTTKRKPTSVTPTQSRDMAITSNEIVSTVNNGTKGNYVVPISQVPLTPRRLFQVKEDEEGDGQYDESKATPVFSTPRRSPRRTPRRSPPRQTVMTPERILAPQPLCGLSNYKSCANDISSPGKLNDKSLIYAGVLVNGIPETPERYGPHSKVPDEVRSSLPSQVPGSPIRLRLTDTTKCKNSNSHDESDEWSISSSDYFSFRTPFFSSSEFAVTTPSGRPWGNGIIVKMEAPNRMQVQDSDGNVLAIMQNAHTIVPSHIVYGSKPRFPGQRARTYRGGAKDANSQDVSFESLASGNVDNDDFVQYYPWAMIKKDGRLRGDSVSIHMAIAEQQDQANEPRMTANRLKGFSHTPAYRSQHGFDGHGDLSHTLVSRIQHSGGEEADETGAPCCLILPSPVRDGVFDITIAPGIDPVLIICYFSLHVRMDSEPAGLPQMHY